MVWVQLVRSRSWEQNFVSVMTIDLREKTPVCTVHTYLCDTLKQGRIIFNEYFNLFLQKKNKSHTEKPPSFNVIGKNELLYIVLIS